MLTKERKAAVTQLAKMLSITEDMIIHALWNLAEKDGYHVWTIPKKSGGERQIQQALWPLNEIQARIAFRIYPFSVSEINHSYIQGRSHRTAVRPHLDANALFTFDIKDAFPSTRKTKIEFAFFKIGFKENLASLMADLCCYANKDSEEGFLPQGYTSSPYLFNLILKPIDQELFKFARSRHYEVTRYADNFALSTRKNHIPEKDREFAVKLVETLSEGQFRIPPAKTTYDEALGNNVYFEFLRLVIKGPKEGKREIDVLDEMLTEYQGSIQDALEIKDFSAGKLNEIRGKIRYLKSVYKKRPLPKEVWALYGQYKIAWEIAQTGQQFFTLKQ